MLRSNGMSVNVAHKGTLEQIARQLASTHEELAQQIAPQLVKLKISVPQPISIHEDFALAFSALDEFPNPPLDDTPLIVRIEELLRPFRPQPLMFKDPMPRSELTPLAVGTPDDALLDTAFERGYQEMAMLLKGAMLDSSLPRLQASLNQPICPLKPRTATKGKGINHRMMAMLTREGADIATLMGWTAQLWADHLKCSPGTVKETPAWRVIKNLRNGSKLAALTDDDELDSDDA